METQKNRTRFQIEKLEERIAPAIVLVNPGGNTPQGSQCEQRAGDRSGQSGGPRPTRTELMLRTLGAAALTSLDRGPHLSRFYT